MNVQTYTKNELGTDYIVGDIHGAFALLATELLKINFDQTKDRLFSVGDLVDRGDDSEAALTWLKKPWFFAVRGNHEQMAIDFGTYAGMDRSTYAYNGGQWFLDLDKDDRKLYQDAFKALPYMIELEADIGKIGIIHAEVPGDDWNKAVQMAYNRDIRGVEFDINDPFPNVALWNRDRITYNVKTNVQNIDYVVVGHTPQKEMKTLGNVLYIDTGAVFKGRGHFTILRANDLFHVNYVP